MKLLPGTVEPPKADGIERAVLGALLMDNSQVPIVRDLGLTARDFYAPAHERIFAAVETLDDAGKTFDTLVLANELEARGQLEPAGGRLYISELLDDVYHTLTMREHVAVLKEKTTRRRALQTFRQLAAEAGDETQPIADFLATAEAAIYDLGTGKLRPGARKTKSLIGPLLRQMDARSKNPGISGVPSGYKELDDLTCGWQPGDLIIVGARPSVGKTALALNFAVHAARAGKAVAFFSMEMTALALCQRLMAMLSGVDAGRIRDGYFHRDDNPRISAAAQEIANLSLAIDDYAEHGASSLRSAARRARREGKAELIVVDYLQLMEEPGPWRNKTESIGKISRALKLAAKELGVPVIVLSQLSRESERRTGKARRPQLSDLRDSGAIEQDADVVLLVHREPQDDSDEAKFSPTGPVEVIVAKQRNGPVGKVVLAWDGTRQRFSPRPGAGEATTEHCDHRAGPDGDF